MSGVLSRLLRRDTPTDDAADPAQEPSGEQSSTEPGGSAEAAPAAVPRTRFGAWLGRPMTSFHLIVSIAALLVTLGLIMVLSASGVRSYDDDGSAWLIFGKQVLWTTIGLFAGY